MVLGVGEGPKPSVPVGLQGVGHEAIVGIDAPVSALGECRLVPRPLELLAAQAVDLVGPVHALFLLNILSNYV